MISVKAEFCGKELILETGLLAKQAHGSVTLRVGDTTILSTVVADKNPKLESDFFPLMVNYNERYYAGGKIPGGFLKREGRPKDKEILISRIIDRPIRPLFPEGFRNEVQVVPTVLSVDTELQTDALAIIASSASLMISWVPFSGPVAAVRVGYVDGTLLVNPTNEDLKRSDLDIIVAGTADAILMIEGEAKEVSEAIFIEAVELAHKEMQPYIEMQIELQRLCKTEKLEMPLFKFDEILKKEVEEYATEKIRNANENADKMKRNENMKLAYNETVEAFKDKYEEDKIKQIPAICHAIEEVVVRDAIVMHEKRPDGRALDEIRALDVQVGILPRVHGCGLFTRGQTQCLSAITLGSEKDSQLLDDMYGKENKNFMLHYNFPPFSVGEVGRYGSPGRREIGHGNLAERSFNAVLPTKEAFPYTIRIVAEILESNGSSSMATICASTLGMLNAGVPLKDSVAGIAMGLVTCEDKYKVLTDIQGVEDHLGDMDFKVAGTKNGITAFQLDIKLLGISSSILQEALEQAKKARLEILTAMDKVITNAGNEVSDNAPKFKTIHVNTDKIRILIGPGGKNIKAIIEETGSDVDIQDTGIVTIFSSSTDIMDKTIALIERYTKEPEIDDIYQGTVKNITDFGAFVEISPGVEGLCHISELAYERVESVDQILNTGDVIEVKVISLSSGKIGLSRKALLEKPEGYVEPPKRSNFNNDSGRRNDNNNRDRGYNRDRDGRR